MLRLRSARRALLALPVLAAAILILLFLTGQSGPARPMGVFGIDPAELEEGFGILVYPPNGAPAISAEEAITYAEATDGDGGVAGVELVHLKLVYGGFDGLAWVVKWDVDGKEAFHPIGLQEAAQEPPWRYLFNLTFIDAKTGAFVTGAELTSPVSDLEKAREDILE